MNREQQIAQIMDTFRFDRVWLAMGTLGWTWRDLGIPTVDVLRGEAQRLLEGVEEGTKSSCGGFEVACEGGVLSLVFVLEEESSDAIPTPA